VSDGRFTEAEIASARRIAVAGTKTDREIQEQLVLDSFIRRQVTTLNQRNPVGQARLSLMPQGYRRPL
jgi:hypothetical protein